MLKIGDILWVFDKESYSVYEISRLSPIVLNHCEFYFVTTNVIIGDCSINFIIPVYEDYNKLVKIPGAFTFYYTISEREAVKFIKSHYNETNNQRDIQQDASK